MLRITRIEETESLAKLTVEGRLVGEAVAVFEAECLDLLQHRMQVELGFTEVSFVDVPGIRALKRLIEQGVRIVGASPTVEALLAGDDSSA